MNRNESWLRRQSARFALFFETANPVTQSSIVLLVISLLLVLFYFGGVLAGVPWPSSASGEYGAHDPRIEEAKERAALKNEITDAR